MLHIDEIENAIEKVLIEEGHAKTAKAYILNRQEEDQKRKEKEFFVKWFGKWS